VPRGARHPLTTLTERIADVFVGMGYEVADGPELEAEWLNFDALNIGRDHPARTMTDTRFVAPAGGGPGRRPRPHRGTPARHARPPGAQPVRRRRDARAAHLVSLTTPHRTAQATATETDAWGDTRLTGVGRPPFRVELLDGA
jgi:phenylalanyl-tRNA synthetase alpha subunit